MSAPPAPIADDNGLLRGPDAAGRQIGQNIRPLKTGEMIASYLRGKIVRGELAEGDCLPSEVELMRQFDVSRPTLREAFRILEAESLIGVRRGSRGGAQVLEPDPAVAARHVGCSCSCGAPPSRTSTKPAW